MDCDESIARPTRLWRGGRVRGWHGDRRAALAAARRHPDRDDARVHRRDRRARRGLRRDRLHACAARHRRTPHQRTAASDDAHSTTRHPRLGAVGAVGRRPAMAGGRVLASSCSPSSPTRSSPRARAEQHRRTPDRYHARQSYDQMTKGFGVGSNGPVLVTVKLSKAAQPAPGQTSPSSDPSLQSLRNAIASTAGVQSVTQPLVNSPGPRPSTPVQSRPRRPPRTRRSSSTGCVTTCSRVRPRVRA